MRLLLILPITMLMLFSAQVSAEKLLKGVPLSRGSTGTEEKKWYYPYEIGELRIRQSNDGSGIINNVTCPDCDYKFVKITPDTEVFVNGVKVEVLRARERAGQDAYIKFDKATAEVKQIYWSE